MVGDRRAARLRIRPLIGTLECSRPLHHEFVIKNFNVSEMAVAEAFVAFLLLWLALPYIGISTKYEIRYMEQDFCSFPRLLKDTTAAYDQWILPVVRMQCVQARLPSLSRR